MRKQEEALREQFVRLLDEGWPVQAAAVRAGVSERTGYRWKREVATAKELAAGQVAAGAREASRKEALRSLIRRVTGYVTQEEKCTYELDEAGERRMKSEVVTRKEVAPDLAAIVFVLTNTDAVHWQAKPVRAAKAPGDGGTEAAGGDDAAGMDDGPDLSQLSDEAFRELLALLEGDSREIVQPVVAPDDLSREDV